MDVHGDEWSLNFLTPDDNTHIHNQNNKINGEQTFDKVIHLCQNYVVVHGAGGVGEGNKTCDPLQMRGQRFIQLCSDLPRYQSLQSKISKINSHALDTLTITLPFKSKKLISMDAFIWPKGIYNE